MMDFLEKLYSYEYFPQILFATIGILLVLLVIVIMFGKKDEKIRKEEETKRLELAGLDAFAQEETNQVSLEVAPNEENLIQVDTSNENLNITSEPMVSESTELQITNEVYTEAKDLVDNAINNSISSAVGSETNNEDKEMKLESNESSSEDNESFMIPDFEIFKEEEKAEYQTSTIEVEQEIPLSLDELHQKSENVIDEKIKTEELPIENKFENTAVLPEFNFDELASSISKELDEINKLQEQASKSADEKESAIPDKIDVTPIKEVTKFTPSSVFSSVYVNKEREISPVISEGTKDKKEEVKPVLEEKTVEEIPMIRNIADEPQKEIKEDEEIQSMSPVKPVVTNPFIFDMPAKKEEKDDKPKDEENNATINIPDFSSFQNETYEIK